MYQSLNLPSTQEVTSKTIYSPGVRPGSFLVPGLPELLATSSRHTISTVNNPMTFGLTNFPLHMSKTYPSPIYGGISRDFFRNTRFKVPQPITYRTGRFEGIRQVPVDVEKPIPMDIYRPLPIEYLKQILYPVPVGGPVTLAPSDPFNLPYYASTKYQGFNTQLTPLNNAPGFHTLSHLAPHNIESKPNPFHFSLNFVPHYVI